MYKTLRIIRIAVALLSLAVLTYGIVCGVSTVVERVQPVTSLLAGSGTWLVVWLALTAIFGRVYCSTLCPLAVVMDLGGRLARRRRRRYRPALNVLRYVVLAAVAFGAAGGVMALARDLDPVGVFRYVVETAVAVAGGGAVALSAVALATAVMVVLTASGWWRGRVVCNTLCPTGAMLSLLSRSSLYHPDINPDLCVGCGECARVCKAECIDAVAHTVDASRCVVCFDCMAVCPNDAITYRRGRHRLTMPLMQRVAPSLDIQRPALDSKPLVTDQSSNTPTDETIS